MRPLFPSLLQLLDAFGTSCVWIAKTRWAERYASLAWHNPPASPLTTQWCWKRGMCLHHLAQHCDFVTMSHMWRRPACF